MNRNGMGPGNNGPGTGWGRGGCVSEGTAAFAGRRYAMGKGRGRGIANFRNAGFSEEELLARIEALEEAIKTMRSEQK